MLYHIGEHIDFTKPVQKTERLGTTKLYEIGTEFRFVNLLEATGILRVGKSLNLILVQ